MQTTAIFAELVVIGGGTAISLLLLVLAAFGVEWVPTKYVSSPQALVPFIFISYMLGIIVDRIGDRILRKTAEKIRRSWFKTHDEYLDARRDVMTDSPFRDLFDYSRSRLRIARGWILNGLALAVATTVFVLTLPDEFPRGQIIAVATVLLIGVTVGSAFAWYQLTEAEARNIYAQQHRKTAERVS